MFPRDCLPVVEWTLHEGIDRGKRAGTRPSLNESSARYPHHAQQAVQTVARTLLSNVVPHSSLHWKTGRGEWVATRRSGRRRFFVSQSQSQIAR